MPTYGLCILFDSQDEIVVSKSGISPSSHLASYDNIGVGICRQGQARTKQTYVLRKLFDNLGELVIDVRFSRLLAVNSD